MAGGAAVRAKGRLGWLAAGLAVAIAAALMPAELEAQTVKVRFSGVDMLGGSVWPNDADIGVAFGTRLGIADLFDAAVQLGLEMDWWTAALKGVDLDLRDIMGGIAVWHEFGARSWIRPYLGLGFALHVFDTSSRIEPVGPALVVSDRMDGYRGGASGFGGLAARLSRTGAIWLVAEYRYTAVSGVSYQELRAGFRLRFARR